MDGRSLASYPWMYGTRCGRQSEGRALVKPACCRLARDSGAARAPVAVRSADARASGRASYCVIYL